MVDGVSHAVSPGDGGDHAARIQTILTAFRQVGMPLLQALAEGPGAKTDATAPNLSGEKFSALVESTVGLSRALAAQLGAGEEQIDAWVRWALAGAASQAVAARFKVTGEALQPD